MDRARPPETNLARDVLSFLTCPVSLNDFCCRVKNCFAGLFCVLRENGFMRIMRIITGLVLLPCCVAATRTFLFVISAPGLAGRQIPAPPVLAMTGGFILWLAVFALLPRPTRMYVLAHELSHAIWGVAFEARVSGMRVSKNSGHVKLSKHNFVVALAPYFFPLYTVAAILCYWLLAVFVDVRGFYLAWLALIGFTLGFHLSFTLDALSSPQSDIREYGRLFSYSLIYLLCILEVTLLTAVVSPSVTLEVFVKQLGSDMTGAWTWCWSALRVLSEFVVFRRMKQ